LAIKGLRYLSWYPFKNLLQIPGIFRTFSVDFPGQSFQDKLRKKTKFLTNEDKVAWCPFSRTFQDKISNSPKFKDLPGYSRTKFKFQDVPGFF